ncbi:AbgT family transporter [Corynebacterium hadale]|uniref:AbgT family transporter n=1 Tax=Corynebacterium hadale TaxID=2026255 RepID=UPI0020B13E09|nr:AbgT family transporter [Corynebacterium hadale]
MGDPELSFANTTAGNSPDDANDEDLELSPTESKALKAAGLALLTFLAVFFLLLFVPGSPLANPDEGFMKSPLITAIAVLISIGFFLCGLPFGLVAGTINSSADVPGMMYTCLKSLLPMLVLFSAVSRFLAWFEWPNLVMRCTLPSELSRFLPHRGSMMPRPNSYPSRLSGWIRPRRADSALLSWSLMWRACATSTASSRAIPACMPSGSAACRRTAGPRVLRAAAGRRRSGRGRLWIRGTWPSLAPLRTPSCSCPWVCVMNTPC